MDISREYISGCHAAMEVQKEWSPQKGDTYYILEHDNVGFDSDVYRMNQWKISSITFLKSSRVYGFTKTPLKPLGIIFE